MGHVILQHPKLKNARFTCALEAVPTYEGLGWKVVGGADSPDDLRTADEVAAAEAERAQTIEDAAVAASGAKPPAEPETPVEAPPFEADEGNQTAPKGKDTKTAADAATKGGLTDGR